ncbi:hypothetical protein, partial [Staphylococcus aureus]|uniref:hypothetical protein n=1 Tax=Staphylococcus aureus TaxID=1280 RepID=UPI0039BEC087
VASWGESRCLMELRIVTDRTAANPTRQPAGGALPGAALRRARLWISLWGKLAAVRGMRGSGRLVHLFHVKNIFISISCGVNMMSSARHGL